MRRLKPAATKWTMVKICEHKHRLSPSLYKGSIIVSFTACIAERRPVLNEMTIYQPLSQMLFNSLKKWNCDAHVFLFMPDHCHLLIQGNTDNSNLLAFMKDFKQRSGYWFSKNIPNVRWQKDFYDHILREDEDIKKQAYYILDNPVRKGLVSNWKEYKLKGSTIHDLNKW
ncbi:MAG: transposase [Deltaproteobacteria bacterium]|nr:transposase [Deltaproteobacteria bacterium]